MPGAAFSMQKVIRARVRAAAQGMIVFHVWRFSTTPAPLSVCCLPLIMSSNATALRTNYSDERSDECKTFNTATFLHFLSFLRTPCWRINIYIFNKISSQTQDPEGVRWWTDSVVMSSEQTASVRLPREYIGLCILQHLKYAVGLKEWKIVAKVIALVLTFSQRFRYN